MINAKLSRKLLCLTLATVMSVCFMPSVAFNSHAAKKVKVKKLTRLKPTRSKNLVVAGIGKDHRQKFKVKSSPKKGVPKSYLKTRYTSSNKKVARISKKGSMIPVSAGTTRITCKNLKSGAKTHWNVRVLKKPIKLKKKSPEGEYVAHMYVKGDSDASRLRYCVIRETKEVLGRDIVFKSSNSKILKISKKGSAIAKGVTPEDTFVKITAYNKLTGGTAVWKVVVIDKLAKDEAIKAAKAFTTKVKALPSADKLKLQDRPKVEQAKTDYENLTKAALALVEKETLDRYRAIVEAMDHIVKTETVSVKKVNRIYTSGIRVEIDAPVKDLTGKTVEVKDGAGKVHEVIAQNISKGSTKVTFSFVTDVDVKTLTGVWTVDGVSYDADEFKKVEDVLGAGNQLDLKKAFTALGIENLKDDNYSKYMLKIAGLTTAQKEEMDKAGIQALVDEVNTGVIVSKDHAKLATDIRDAVEANNQVMLRTLLENPEFKNFYKTSISSEVDTAFETMYFMTNTIAIGSGSYNVFTGKLTLPSKSVKKELSGADFDNIQNWIYKNNIKVIDDMVTKAAGNIGKLKEVKAVALKTQADRNKEVDYLIADNIPSKIMAKVGELPSESIQKGINSILAEKKINDVLTAAAALAAGNETTANNFISALNKIEGVKHLPNKGIVMLGAVKYRLKVKSPITTIDQLNEKLDAGTVAVIADATLTNKDNVISHLSTLNISNVEPSNNEVYADATTFNGATKVSDIQNAVNIVNNNVKIKSAFKKFKVGASNTEIKEALDEISKYYVINVTASNKPYAGNESYAVAKVMTDLSSSKTLITPASEAYTMPSIAKVNALVSAINALTAV